jgi:hypothetical protein
MCQVSLNPHGGRSRFADISSAFLFSAFLFNESRITELTNSSTMDNGIFTCMLTEREWTQFSRKRASLSVTIPSSGQWSTHFLQLPDRWSAPLLIAAAIVH